uniref:SAM domain-containing protein n=1 Tax=Macrostomum lignano TaxID=282301 RepID=A0A1I8FLP2_9PLAT
PAVANRLILKASSIVNRPQEFKPQSELRHSSNDSKPATTEAARDGVLSRSVARGNAKRGEGETRHRRENGMSPVDQCDCTFAALNGHMNCVTFLVNLVPIFGFMDNDFHTALDLAGLRDHRDIVDTWMALAKQVSMNRRVVIQDGARRQRWRPQKRVKKFDRLMRKTSKKLAKNDRQQSPTELPAPEQGRNGEDDASDQSPRQSRQRSCVLRSDSSRKLRWSPPASLSFLVSISRRVTLRPDLRKRQRSSSNGRGPFSEYLTSARSNRSRYTFRVQTLSTREDKRRWTFYFVRTVSEPDMQQQQDAGLFERPGFGSVAFFHRHPRHGALPGGALMAKTLSSLKDAPPLGQQPQPQPHPMLLQPPSPSYSRRSGSSDSIGTSGSLLRRTTTTNDDVDGRLGGGKGTLRPRKQADLELFLTCLGLPDCMPALAREQIDLDSLSLCTDADLQTLGLPLGPRRKILEARCSGRRVAFERRDCLVDLRL